MKHTAILAAVAASFIATQAYATGPVETPIVVVNPPAPVSDWTGFYVGLQAGAGNSVFTHALIPIPVGLALNHSIGGVHAGYLHDMGSFVLGGEISYNQVGLSGLGFLPGRINHAQLDLVAGWDAGEVMPFLTLGAGSLSYSGPIVLPSQNNVSVGFGVAAKVTDNVIVRAQVRRDVYKNFLTPPLPIPPGLTNTANTYIFGASYQF